MGLIELRPNRTPVIRKLTADDVAKLYTVREALELLALDLALARIEPAAVQRLAREAERLNPPQAGAAWTKQALELDSHLHGLWFERCDNRWLEDVLGQFWTFIRILQQVVARDPAAVQRAFQEHLLILEALAARDHADTRAAPRSSRRPRTRDRTRSKGMAGWSVATANLAQVNFIGATANPTKPPRARSTAVTCTRTPRVAARWVWRTGCARGSTRTNAITREPRRLVSRRKLVTPTLSSA